MAIENSYKDLLLEKLIRDQLEAGVVPDALEIEVEFAALIAASDLSVPQFVPADNYVVSKEKASATKFNGTFKSIQQDLKVAYKNMLDLSSRSINDHERWHAEAQILEKRLIDLEATITDLLLLIQDTEGYFDFLIDNFTDTTLTDQVATTANVDIKHQVVSLDKNSGTAVTQLFLNDLDPSNVTFKVRNSIDFISRVDAEGSKLTDIFSQTSNSWWTQIQMRVVKPVICELVVKLGDAPVEISRIDIALHDSSQSSPMNVTPLYSTDNFNFSQVPSNTYNMDVRSIGTFQFSPVQAQWVKLLLTKAGPDPATQNQLLYEFGFKSISFYAESFSSDTTQQFITVPLSVKDPNGLPVPFSKVALEVCNRIDANTSIAYYLTASNDPAVPTNGQTPWYRVTPKGLVNPIYPNVLDFGDIEEETFTAHISYSGRNPNPNFVNPSDSFSLLSKNISGVTEETVTTPSLVRYSFANSNDRILDLQIKFEDYVGSGSGTALNIDQSNIELFRNKGTKGLVATDSTSKVRGIQKGWDFVDPYYSTVILVLNPNGITLNVGDKALIIDEVSYTNRIDNKVLSGKVGSQTGIHYLKVHKDNWVPVAPNATTLAGLQAIDPLYPYNHKLLIEGYQYDVTYPSNVEQVYIGADLFAEYLMKQASVFDLVHNIAKDNFTYYALDKDIPGTHTGGNLPTNVFLLKVDDQNPDFQNEEFVLTFKVINQKYKYLRLKAELSTEDSGVTPALTSYKLKLA